MARGRRKKGHALNAEEGSGSEKTCLWRLIVAALAITIVTTGCSIVAPNVRPTTTRPAITIPASNKLPDLAGALAYSRAYVDEYAKAGKEHSSFNIYSAIALIPFSTFTIIKAVNGTGEKHLASLAGGALGGYTLSSFLGSAKYSLAYIRGRKALLCANSAVSSATIGEDDLKVLSSAIDSLPGELSTLADRLANASLTAVQATGEPADSTATADNRKKALELLQQGSDRMRRAVVARAFVREAANRLVDTVDLIAAAVDADIDSATGDFQAYRSIVAGVLPQAMQAKFEIPPKPPVPPTLPAGAGTRPESTGNQAPQSTRTSLAEAINAVSTTYIKLDARLESLDVEAARAALTQCLSST
jgi:hypothetical protein